MKKKILAVLLSAVLASLALTGCGSDPAATDTDRDGIGNTKISFVLDWTPNTNHTGIYAAQALGYFEEAGLDVEIVQPPDGGAEAMVGSGKAQFGVSFQDEMGPAISGDTKSIPITAVAAILQHNFSGIMSAKGNGITSPKGLEGKTYATWEIPLEQAIMKQTVEDDGGDFSKVEMIPLTIDDEVSALRAGQIDSIQVYYGWAGINAKVKGFDVDYYSFRDINEVFDFYSPVIIANDDFLQNEPETAKAFMAAVSKGYQYAIDHPAEAADILIEANPEIDQDLVRASQEFLSPEYQADAARWGEFDADRWNNFYHFINEKGLFDEELRDNVGFTNDFLPQ